MSNVRKLSPEDETAVLKDWEAVCMKSDKPLSREETVARTLWITAGTPTVQREWRKLPKSIKAHYMVLAGAAVRAADAWTEASRA